MISRTKAENQAIIVRLLSDIVHRKTNSLKASGLPETLGFDVKTLINKNSNTKNRLLAALDIIIKLFEEFSPEERLEMLLSIAPDKSENDHVARTYRSHLVQCGVAKQIIPASLILDEKLTLSHGLSFGTNIGAVLTRVASVHQNNNDLTIAFIRFMTLFNLPSQRKTQDELFSLLTDARNALGKQNCRISAKNIDELAALMRLANLNGHYYFCEKLFHTFFKDIKKTEKSIVSVLGAIDISRRDRLFNPLHISAISIENFIHIVRLMPDRTDLQILIQYIFTHSSKFTMPELFDLIIMPWLSQKRLSAEMLESWRLVHLMNHFGFKTTLQIFNILEGKMTSSDKQIRHLVADLYVSVIKNEESHTTDILTRCVDKLSSEPYNFSEVELIIHCEKVIRAAGKFTFDSDRLFALINKCRTRGMHRLAEMLALELVTADDSILKDFRKIEKLFTSLQEDKRLALLFAIERRQNVVFVTKMLAAEHLSYDSKQRMLSRSIAAMPNTMDEISLYEKWKRTDIDFIDRKNLVSSAFDFVQHFGNVNFPHGMNHILSSYKDAILQDPDLTNRIIILLVSIIEISRTALYRILINNHMVTSHNYVITAKELLSSDRSEMLIDVLRVTVFEKDKANLLCEAISDDASVLSVDRFVTAASLLKTSEARKQVVSCYLNANSKQLDLSERLDLLNHFFSNKLISIADYDLDGHLSENNFLDYLTRILPRNRMAFILSKMQIADRVPLDSFKLQLEKHEYEFLFSRSAIIDILNAFLPSVLYSDRIHHLLNCIRRAQNAEELVVYLRANYDCGSPNAPRIAGAQYDNCLPKLSIFSFSYDDMMKRCEVIAKSAIQQPCGTSTYHNQS